jgi:hypothetical protein
MAVMTYEFMTYHLCGWFGSVWGFKWGKTCCLFQFCSISGFKWGKTCSFFICKCYIVYMKPLYRQNSHYIGKSTDLSTSHQVGTLSTWLDLSTWKPWWLCHARVDLWSDDAIMYLWVEQTWLYEIANSIIHKCMPSMNFSCTCIHY